MYIDSQKIYVLSLLKFKRFLLIFGVWVFQNLAVPSKWAMQKKDDRKELEENMDERIVVSLFSYFVRRRVVKQSRQANQLIVSEYQCPK